MKLEDLKILLADDDADDCMFFKLAIQELLPVKNFTALHDGEKLMTFLNLKTTELPHILFLDLNMPRKNGFECLSEVKINKNLRHIPVIMFSTSFEQGVVNQLYNNGARHFIRKPSEFSQFKKIIQQTLILLTQDRVSEPSMENFVLTLHNNI